MYAESLLCTMVISKTINSFIIHPMLYGGCCFSPCSTWLRALFYALKKKKQTETGPVPALCCIGFFYIIRIKHKNVSILMKSII